MTTFDTGRKAEFAAAAYLTRQGCRIIGQNWRTRWCEIDIVAFRSDTMYLCEVKYRKHGRQGYGLEYITPQKLRQMQFAAHLWAVQHNWRGLYELCAIEVTGSDFKITAVIKDL